MVGNHKKSQKTTKTHEKTGKATKNWETSPESTERHSLRLLKLGTYFAKNLGMYGKM